MKTKIKYISLAVIVCTVSCVAILKAIDFTENTEENYNFLKSFQYMKNDCNFQYHTKYTYPRKDYEVVQGTMALNGNKVYDSNSRQTYVYDEKYLYVANHETKLYNLITDQNIKNTFGQQAIPAYYDYLIHDSNFLSRTTNIIYNKGTDTFWVDYFMNIDTNKIQSLKVKYCKASDIPLEYICKFRYDLPLDYYDEEESDELDILDESKAFVDVEFRAYNIHKNPNEDIFDAERFITYQGDKIFPRIHKQYHPLSEIKENL